ncbi:hypothetical protein N7G274_001872 [Stereocaulon virgatum]|uniref:Uncharacterized protein n=1 Tax=Stereocaulon virgatum TaxID=373712 RepID=A0ABR4AMI8_9LECA
MSGVNPELEIGVWDLEPTDQELCANTLLLKVKGGVNPAESTFKSDLRKEVLPEGFQPAIVKIRIMYENQNEDDHRWAMEIG